MAYKTLMKKPNRSVVSAGTGFLTNTLFTAPFGRVRERGVTGLITLRDMSYNDAIGFSVGDKVHVKSTDGIYNVNTVVIEIGLFGPGTDTNYLDCTETYTIDALVGVVNQRSNPPNSIVLG